MKKYRNIQSDFQLSSIQDPFIFQRDNDPKNVNAVKPNLDRKTQWSTISDLEQCELI